MRDFPVERREVELNRDTRNQAIFFAIEDQQEWHASVDFVLHYYSVLELEVGV